VTTSKSCWLETAPLSRILTKTRRKISTGNLLAELVFSKLGNDGGIAKLGYVFEITAISAFSTIKLPQQHAQITIKKKLFDNLALTKQNREAKTSLQYSY